jgi:hypothetical protein
VGNTAPGFGRERAASNADLLFLMKGLRSRHIIIDVLAVFAQEINFLLLSVLEITAPIMAGALN